MNLNDNIELMNLSPFHSKDSNESESNQDTTPMITDINSRDWDILWRNVTKVIDVKVYNKKIKREILSNSSGYVKAGEMLAIVGSSGYYHHNYDNCYYYY